MPTGFTYANYQAAVVTQIPSFTSDPNFQQILPVGISYAELSICRDLDFLAMHGLLSLGTTTIGTQTQSIPTDVVVLESLYYGPNSIPVVPASQDYIRTVFAGAASGPPQNFMTIGAATGIGWTPGMQVLLGPAPDQTYMLTGYVTKRQETLSADNPTTFISTQLPDLFWSASMIFFAGYNRNFGAQSDDPRQAVSWSAEYARQLKSVNTEEMRKKFMNHMGDAKMPSMAGAPA